MATQPLTVIALDWPTTDARVHSVSYGSRTTLLDYDVALWSPAGLLQRYQRDRYPTYQGLPNLSEDSSFAIKRDISRRREEMARFLSLGKTLVVELPTPTSWYVDSGERQYSGTGRNRQRTTLVTSMSLTDAFPWSVDLKAAEGSKMRLKTGEPFASFWQAMGEWFDYHAYMEESVGTPLATIEGTDLTVASLHRVGKGTVLALPMFALDDPWPIDPADYESREDLAEARRQLRNRNKVEKRFLDGLLTLIGAIRADLGQYEMPAWAETMRLPREETLTAELRRTEVRLARLVKTVDDKTVELNVIASRKLLFTGTGPALEQMVDQAFSALGCEVLDGEPGRTDRVVRTRDRLAVVEIKGKTKSASESDAAQLEKWVSDRTLSGEGSPKGILVVNGWRRKPLSERTAEVFPHQMRAYSEKRDHCLISGVQLLGAWLDAERNPTSRQEIVSSILDCVGVYGRYRDWNGFLDHRAVPTTARELRSAND
ncbi:MAG: hypothetical protein ACJ76L_01280 [Conexibacter sp.]